MLKHVTHCRSMQGLVGGSFPRRPPTSGQTAKQTVTTLWKLALSPRAVRGASGAQQSVAGEEVEGSLLVTRRFRSEFIAMLLICISLLPGAQFSTTLHLGSCTHLCRAWRQIRTLHTLTPLARLPAHVAQWKTIPQEARKGRIRPQSFPGDKQQNPLCSQQLSWASLHLWNT